MIFLFLGKQTIVISAPKGSPMTQKVITTGAKQPQQIIVVTNPQAVKNSQTITTVQAGSAPKQQGVKMIVVSQGGQPVRVSFNQLRTRRIYQSLDLRISSEF